MFKTIIITESTEMGVDKKLLSELIKNRISEDFFNSVEITPRTDTYGVCKELKTGLQEAKLRDGNIKNLLIIVDADENPESRFKEIKTALSENSNKNFNIPDGLNIVDKKDSEKINVGIFLFPDCENKGSLETLCLEAIKHDKKKEKLDCVEKYFNCLKGKKIDISEETENNKSKSKFQVFMATPKSDRYVKNIINHIDLKSDAFNKLMDFIKKTEL